ncbi:MAG: VTC domain-containing protein, partial [Clostridiales bacterium]|nr:VTC domain-containing protein [Clostridiales bacterium]
IVSYIREPFVYVPGNVRLTLDRDIRTGMYSTDFLSNERREIPAGENEILLEVKYDAFLPGIITDLVQLPNRMASSFSKYAACRMYG